METDFSMMNFMFLPHSLPRRSQKKFIAPKIFLWMRSDALKIKEPSSASVQVIQSWALNLERKDQLINMRHQQPPILYGTKQNCMSPGPVNFLFIITLDLFQGRWKIWRASPDIKTGINLLELHRNTKYSPLTFLEIRVHVISWSNRSYFIM